MFLEVKGMVSIGSGLYAVICLSLHRGNISNTRDSVASGYPNIGKRAENTTSSRVFLTKFEVFG